VFSIVTRLRTGRSRVQIPAGARFSVSSKRTHGLWGSHSLQFVKGDLHLGGKRRVREADHTPPSTTEVTSDWRYFSTTLHAFTACTATAF
jgi:hypothetical protein